MAPKRGAKAKSEEVAVPVEAAANDVPAGKKKGKAAKAAPEKPVEEAPAEVIKNGTSKKAKKEEAEPQVEAKSPAKRGRKPKADAASQPPAKKAKADEEKEVEDEPKSKRGRKPAASAPAKKEEKPKNAKAKKEPAEDKSSEEVPAEEPSSPAEAKQPAKRGRKKADIDNEAKPAAAAGAKKRGAKEEGLPEPKKKSTKQLQNKTSSDYASIDYSCDKLSSTGKSWNFKISSWNVDGIRAWLNKGGLEYIHHEKPDILCLQETKCSQDKLPSEVSSVPGYHAYWLTGDQEGYAGVGVYTKKMAIHVTYGLGNKDLDSEGRIITAEYEQFYLICTYVPNAGRGLVTLPKRLQWNDEFRKYVKDLDTKKPVIICGDMNVSHLEIDLANPKTNKKNAGFTQEERDGMSDFLGDGFVDTYRHLYPDKTGCYTFWTYMSNCRAKNVGWRLDYAIVSERLMSSVCDNVIRSEVFGSDHCPITLFLHVNGLEKLDKD